MFTLLRNFRAMFMLTVANYNLDAPSGPTEAELRLAEAAEISENTREKLIDFQAAMEYFSNEDATLDKSLRDKNKPVTIDVQELLNLISVNSGNAEISAKKADGDFGPGTERAVKAFQVSKGLEADGIVTAELYQMIVEASGIESYTETIRAAEAQAEQETEEERQSNLQVVAGFDWENRDNASEDEIKALQQALQNLGKPVNTIDGVITPGGATEREFNAIQGEIQEMQYQAALGRLESNKNMTADERRQLATQAIRSADQFVTSKGEFEDMVENGLNGSPYTDSFQEATNQMYNDAIKADELSERLNDSNIKSAEDDLERNFPQVQEVEMTIPDVSEINDYSRKSIPEMNKYEKEALQRDINAVLSSAGDELIGVDGGIGPISNAAMAKIGVYNTEADVYNLTALVRLAQIARNGSHIESSLEAANNYQELRMEADKLFSSIPLDPTGEELTRIIAELAILTDVGDDDGDGKDDWTESNKTQRFLMAQYVTDKASRMVDSGKISNQQASQILLGVLAQEKFESKPGRASIAKMVSNTVDDINALSRNESGQEIGSSFSESQAINAIMNSREPMSMGTSLERGYFEVANRKYDIDRAEDFYCVTGNSTQRISMRDTAGFDLMNVSIVGNTIVGMMENGCEGNVVYIPLDVNTPPRPPRVTRTPTPTATSTPVSTTEVPILVTELPDRNIYRYGSCDNNGNYVFGTYDGTDTYGFKTVANTLTKEVRLNALNCYEGGDSTPTLPRVATNTTTENADEVVEDKGVAEPAANIVESQVGVTRTPPPISQ